MAVTGKLDTLKANINQVTAEFIDLVDEQLQSLGYAIQDVDAWAVGFAIQKVVNTVQNECNSNTVPDGLIQIAVDMVCGEFLFGKKGSGQLQGFEVDLTTAAIKQVHEGDTNIVFALGDGSSTPEQRLDAVIKFLMTNGRKQFVTYRRLTW